MRKLMLFTGLFVFFILITSTFYPSVGKSDESCITDENRFFTTESGFFPYDSTEYRYTSDALDDISSDKEDLSATSIVPGELLIKLKPGVTIDTIKEKTGGITTGISSLDSLNKEYNVYEMRKVFPSTPEETPLTGIYKIQFSTDADISTIVMGYNSNPLIEYAQPNHLAHTTYVPNDPRYDEQWAHQKTQAESGWDIEQGDNNIVIAIIDTGADYTHEDLEENIGPIMNDFVDIDTNAYISQGFSLIDGEDYVGIDDDPMDYFGHGTHCAGIAAACGNNGVGICGVCPNSTLMIIRAGFALRAPDDSEMAFLESDDIAQSIVFAVDNGAQVISMSFGGSWDNIVYEAIQYAYDHNVTMVAAAGNSNSDWEFYPAGHDEVIAVAATAENDSKAHYSNYGSWVDVAAPGGDYFKDTMILSTVPLTGGILSDPSGYRCLQGTSMACPYVTGLVGLMLSHNPGLSPSQLKQSLRRSVDVPLEHDYYIGTGRINVYKALQAELLPFVEITAPCIDDFITHDIDIKGTALGSTYTVSYGEGLYPSDWTQIGAGTSVENDSVAYWNISNLPNGIYTLNLSAGNANGTINDWVFVKIRHDILDGWPFFTHAPILASPISGDIDNDSELEIIIGTYAPTNNPWGGYGKGVVHVLDSHGNEENGWPQETSGPIVATPALADIDGDHSLDLVVGSWNRVYVYNSNGSLHEGWPVQSSYPNTPAIADINGDGNNEIIITTLEGWAYVFDKNGSTITGWPKLLGNQLSSPSVGNIDDDEFLEIVVNSRAALVYAFKHTGEMIPGWPVTLQGINYARYPPVLGDIDHDGRKEIVVSDYNYTYAFENTGAMMAGFPQEVSYGGSIVLADIDSDKDLELVVFGMDYSSGDGIIYAFHHTGETVAGFPYTIWNTGNCVSSFAVGNIDFCTNSNILIKVPNRLIGIDHVAQIVDGFPLEINDHHHYGDLTPTPVITDVDQDGNVDIIATSAFNEVYVFKLQTPYIKSSMKWPMYQHDEQHTGSYSKIEDVQPPYIEITKPDHAVYLMNQMILKYAHKERNPLIIGKIDIEINTSDNISGINRAEFFIDGLFQGNKSIAPFDWTWEKWAFGKHTIKVIAYDNEDNNASKEITVWKFF